MDVGNSMDVVCLQLNSLKLFILLIVFVKYLTGECELDQECVTGMLIGLAVPFCMVESSPCLERIKYLLYYLKQYLCFLSTDQ